jgi:hypothetical protein
MMTMSNRPAVLMRDYVMRVLDISGFGCLIESQRRLEVGTVGNLRLRFGTHEYHDDVEVLRCDLVEGARTVYHVGVRFLWTTPRREGSIRHAVTGDIVTVNAREPIWLM